MTDHHDADHQVEPPRRRRTRKPTRSPRVETPEEAEARARTAEDKRRMNLRFVIEFAQRIRRESDLYHFAHVRRWDHRPGRWTAEQVEQARQFLHGFLRPDGTPQADPIRRKGRWRV
jgi:hypothetical protein